LNHFVNTPLKMYKPITHFIDARPMEMTGNAGCGKERDVKGLSGTSLYTILPAFMFPSPPHKGKTREEKSDNKL